MTSTIPAPPLAPPAPPTRTLASRQMLVSLAVFAVLCDLWLLTVFDGYAGFLAVATLALILSTATPASRSSRIVIGLAVLPALFLFLRTSPWLLIPDLVAVVVLFAVGIGSKQGLGLGDSSFGAFGRHVGVATGSMWHAPAFLARSAADSIAAPTVAGRRTLVAMSRGVFLTLPLIIVLAGLLASADAVFASFFDVSIDLGQSPTYGVVGVVALAIGAGFCREALSPTRPIGQGPRWRLGVVEAYIVLSGLVVVYALFAGAQVVVAMRGSDYVLESTGLTYAEYARSGFFQLLWAAGLTLVVLVAVRSTVVLPTRRAWQAVTTLSLIAVALTLAVVQAAVTRLDLYADTFGLTMLRLYSTGFAWWVGLVFVLTGLALVGVHARRNWLPSAVLASALIGLLALNALDPERLVVEHNVRHAQTTGGFDVEYLSSLSDDAIPPFLAALPDLPVDVAEVERELCRDHDAGQPRPLNLSARRAHRSLDDLCHSS